jgi:signal transduction histidine kinase
VAADEHGATLDLRNRQIAAVHEVTQVLFTKLGLDERLRDVLTLSMQAADAAAGSIYLHRQADDALVFEYVVGPPNSAALVGKAMPSDQGIAGQVFLSGRTVVDNHVRQAERHRRDIGEAVGFITESMVTVPLKTLEGDPVGVMQILNKQTGDFTADDIEVLEIVAAIAATAIENAHLQREAQVAAVARAVGHLSHDIKNKVAPISMVAQLLKPDMDAMFGHLDRLAEDCADGLRCALEQATSLVRSEYEEHCGILLDQVNAVQEHTKRIADVLRGTTTEPQIELADAGPLIEEQVRLLEPVARARHISLTLQSVGAPVQAPLDRFFLRSAVYNLVNNAIPETPEGGTVAVTVAYHAQGVFPEGDCLTIAVADNGAGMPANVLDRILRGDATSTKVGGTGLGTKIVYNAVKAHKGVFEGTSEPGVGTTFTMRLPLTPGAGRA